MKILALTLWIFTLLTFSTSRAYSASSPFDTPNNKIGIHILSPLEINLASEMVNGNGGDWGYVVIPIQVRDKDLKKWQQFMDDARRLHVTPIIRIGTTSDYFNTVSWSKPSFYEIVDFANFLSSLDWPTKNRYIIVFNEPNRADEWGGNPSAQEYAEILDFTVDVFKSKSEDFFIISAGLDNASIDIEGKSINQYNFLRLMEQSIPGIFNKIDGMASHSYPNPGFKQSPFISTSRNIYSFSYEQDLIYSLSGRKLPIFITETGWSAKELDKNAIKKYFEYALNNVWIDNYIVTISPFLLQASETYAEFSFVNSNERELFNLFQNMQKVKGEPFLSSLVDNVNILNSESPLQDNNSIVPEPLKEESRIDLRPLGKITKWLLRI
ncbi:MAG: hypothetical protein HYT08_00620 [Candidatus Levybacteria bacterium]|nr:hypothetical protein [Candidatus Levybacteria bacterium]